MLERDDELIAAVSSAPTPKTGRSTVCTAAVKSFTSREPAGSSRTAAALHAAASCSTRLRASSAARRAAAVPN